MYLIFNHMISIAKIKEANERNLYPLEKIQSFQPPQGFEVGPSLFLKITNIFFQLVDVFFPFFPTSGKY